MRGYIAIIRNSLISYLFFRAEFFFRTLGNLLQIFIVFYLWKAIYANSTGELNGLTFLKTFTYLTVSGSIFVMVGTMVDWEMSLGIIHGEIVMRLYLPLDLHVQTVVRAFGVFLFRVIFSGFPATIAFFSDATSIEASSAPVAGTNPSSVGIYGSRLVA